MASGGRAVGALDAAEDSISRNAVGDSTCGIGAPLHCCWGWGGEGSASLRASCASRSAGRQIQYPTIGKRTDSLVQALALLFRLLVCLLAAARRLAALPACFGLVLVTVVVLLVVVVLARQDGIRARRRAQEVFVRADAGRAVGAHSVAFLRGVSAVQPLAVFRT